MSMQRTNVEAGIRHADPSVPLRRPVPVENTSPERRAARLSSIQARSKTIALVAAVARNGVIGLSGGIPWHLPEDFQHFKKSTLHQTVLMGRTTFESIGRPLPGRDTLVLTRDRSWHRDGVRIAHDLQEAIDMAEDLPGDLMV